MFFDCVYSLQGPVNFMPKPSPPKKDDSTPPPIMAREYVTSLRHARNRPLSTSISSPAARECSSNVP